ncbi:MAG TPA: 6-phosphofructokinase [Phycisphaerae bacterium]|nr:6-phosphofructokinase [Phycisphaerae bacterium]HPS52639.1 6-phosphofructokinase [Phycisphaerae bacterium]
MAKTNIIKGNAVIGQSGGPSAVINQSLVGVIETLKKSRQIPKIFGANHGVRGIVNNKYFDLRKVSAKELEIIAGTPASALGSSRDKPDEEYCQRIFENFKKNDVRYFFYIGGNDSADAARIVNDMAKASGYDLNCFHVPKTIDNDLRVTDHTPGYGSAARFVASAFAGEDRDNAALPGIKVSVVMGRDAGWLTASASLAKYCYGNECDENVGPHLVYVPEIAFDKEKFAADVMKAYKKFGRCLIAVSEGIRDAGGTPMAVSLVEAMGREIERDSHGNAQLSGSGALGDALSEYIKKAFGSQKVRVRADTYGYLQRSFAGYASVVDQAEARNCGRKAAELALSGCTDGTVVMVRKKSAKYGVTFERAELKDVARVTKPLDRKFINKAGNGITKAFADYALPLVGGLPRLGRLY